MLEQLLQERYPARRWRFINTSVPSHNVVTKVETLKEKGLQFEPDLVILHVAANNLDLPNYVRLQEDPFELRKSFLLDFFRETMAGRAETKQLLAHVDKSKLSWNALLKSDPSKIPPRFRDLVGWDPFYGAMDELAELSEQHQFEVITIANLDFDINGRLLEQAAERGFHTVCLMDQIIEHLKSKTGQAFSPDVYMKSDLVVSRGNSHPSPFLHQMIAERIAVEMDELGVIGRLLAAD